MANRETFEVDTLKLPFTGDWIRTNQRAYEGSFSYGSRVISHNQQSNAYLNIVTDYIEFYWFVSSESGYDFFEFYIDGNREIRASGTNNSWSKFSKQLEKGEHTFRWRYFKDGSVSHGDDRAYIDNLIIQTAENRYLIEDGGTIKIWSGEENGYIPLEVEDEMTGELIEITSDLLTEELILSFGMEELPEHTEGLIGSNTRILFYTDDEEVVSNRENFRLKLTEAVKSLPKIAVEKTGRRLQEKISSIVIDDSTTGLSDLQYALSYDGSSWFVFDNISMGWVQVDIFNDAAFSENGMRRADFLAVTEEHYEQLFQPNDYLYLAFRFFKHQLTDSCKFRGIRINYASSVGIDL